MHRSLEVIDREGLDERKSNKLVRRVFHAQSPNPTWSLDGYDKLNQWGFFIHGCMDVYSTYVVWLRAGKSNKAPQAVLQYYLEAVEEQACRSLSGLSKIPIFVC